MPQPHLAEMENRRLILIGGSVRAAAESARRAGWIPIAVDSFGDRETRLVAEQFVPLDLFRSQISQGNSPEILTHSRHIAIAGGLIGTLNSLESLAPAVPGPAGNGQNSNGQHPASRQPTWLGATPETFARTDCPRFLRQVADRARWAFPETIRCGDAVRQSPGRFAGDWLVKRPASSGGLGVQLLAKATHSDGTLQAMTALGEEDDWLQRVVPGKVFGATFVGDGQSAVWIGLSRLLTRRIGTLPHVFAGAIGPLGCCQRLSKKLEQLGHAIVEATGLNGPFNADFILSDKRGDAGEATLLEINPRYSASMEVVEAAYSIDCDEPCSFFDELPRWRHRVETLHGCFDGQRGTQECFAKRVIYAATARTVGPSDFDNLVQQPTRSGTRWIWKDVPARETQIESGHPIATLIAKLGTRIEHAELRRVLRFTGNYGKSTGC